MDKQQLEQICAQVVISAKQAGTFIRDALGQVTDDDIQEKELHSLVSYVDLNAEKMIVAFLRNVIPESNFITEEHTTSGEVNSDSKYTWIIDPLDGTTNFLKGIPIFSVSIALICEEELLVGVVYDIMNDVSYYAWAGGGAYQNGHSIHVSHVAHLDHAIIATGFPYARKKMEAIADLLLLILKEARGVRRLGSAALDLAYTACGRFDGYYETQINAWDVAAGILIVREAGGQVSDFKGAWNPVFSTHILATNPKLYPQIMNLIKQVDMI